MLFQSLIIAFASSSLAQAYGNNLNHAFGSDYGKNYVSIPHNTLSRRACYIDESGVQHCTPTFQLEPNNLHNKVAPRACSNSKCGNTKCVDPKPIVDPKEPIAVAYKAGGCYIDENGQQHCDNTQQCEHVYERH